MYANINNLRLYYEDQGTGPPVVLLHGYPLSSGIFAPQRRALSPYYRVILPDLPGMGRSDIAPPPYSIAQMADDVAALLEQLGIERAAVGGLSMGGYVALAFWRRHAARVRALMLLDTRAEADSETVREGRRKAIATAWTEGPTAIARQMLPQVLGATTHARRPRLIARVRQMMERTPVEGIVLALQAMAGRPDASDLLSGITVPTLVIVGQEDGEAFRAAAQTMAERIPGAQQVVIPQAGHISTLENARAVNRALKTFLARVP